MTRAFVSRRRADEFDALLSAPARTRDAAAYVDLLDVVGALRAVPDVTARAEFVTDLRSQLMIEAARQARPATDDARRLHLTPQQRQGARERRMATVLGGFALVAASGSMAMASQAALPGDVLYPVKRAIENARTNLQPDGSAKVETLIDHAEQRLQEAQQLTAEGADAATVASTLQDFTEQANQAAELALVDYATTGDPTSISELRTFTAHAMSELAALGDVVPDDARAALITAAQYVLQADTAAFHVCPTCGDGGVTELPEFASAPIPILSGILTYQDSAQSVPVPPGYVEHVQDTVDHTGSGTPAQTDPPATDSGDSKPPATITVADPPSGDPGNATNPLDDLGNQIKDDVGHDHHSDDPSDIVVSGVVEGVGGLVDGILGD